MPHQINAAPTKVRDRYPIRQRIADAAWTRRQRTAYPIIIETVTGTKAQIGRLITNPNTIGYDSLHQVSMRGSRWSVRVRRIDRAHPIPSPARRRWQATLPARKRAARYTLIVVPTAGALIAAGNIAWQAWGDDITAGVRILFGSAAIIATAAILAALGSWWNAHGRNGCPGLHCRGCKGGH